MSTMSLLETAYNLALAADRATDSAVGEEVAKIVKLHAKLAVASAWIPIDGVDIAAMAVNTWTMYVRINKALDIPFSENLLKSLAAGIGTNILSNVAGLLVGEGLKLIPGIGTFFGSVMLSATFYTVTIASGIVYMKALTLLLNQQSSLTEVDLKAAMDAFVSDKSAMRQIFTEANNEYETAKKSGELNKKEQ